jgi:hypothetical protein
MFNSYKPVEIRSRFQASIARSNSLRMLRRGGVFALATITVLGIPAQRPTAAETSVQGVQSSEEAKDRGRQFTNATLRDRYGFHVLALAMDPANPTTGGSFPFAISGYYQFNGDGTLYGKDTVSRGRTLEILDREYLGTYQVHPDGTGTLTLFISPVFQPEGRFVITKGGDEVEIIFAVPGNLNAFTLNKQHTR